MNEVEGTNGSARDPRQAPDYPPDRGYPSPPPPGTPAPRQRRVDPALFAAGFFTPILLLVIASLIGWLVSLIGYNEAISIVFGIGGIAVQGIGFLLFFGFLAALIVGRSRGDVRLASYGLGGVWFYGFSLLAGLLLFGACLITLGGLGG